MFFVDSYEPKLVTSGRKLTVYGGFFDVYTSVRFNGVAAYVEDFDDSHVSVIVPDDIPSVASVSVSDGVDVVNVGQVKAVPMDGAPVYDFVKEYPQDSFESMILGLFPKGQLFDLENGSNFRKLVSGLAFALVYVWQLILDMQKALNPLHTDNIDEWEKELNLPEVGVAPQDDDGRRRELYRVWGSKGGCNINYYRKLIALLGIDATIFEYTKNPERFAGYVFPENAIPQYYLMIRFKIHRQEFSYFTAGVSGAGDRVMDFTDNFLESIFEKSRHAHIKIAYSYLTEEYVNLVTNDGKKFVTSDGKKLIGFQFME